MLTNDLFLNRKPQNENKMFPRFPACKENNIMFF